MTDSNKVDPEALLCALILAPRTFSRNRFHDLFENPEYRRVRWRARRVRGVIRQLLGSGKERAEMLGQQELDDGRVLLRYRVPALAFERTTSLSALEAAALNYTLGKVGLSECRDLDREHIETALARLGLPVASDFPTGRQGR